MSYFKVPVRSDLEVTIYPIPEDLCLAWPDFDGRPMGYLMNFWSPRFGVLNVLVTRHAAIVFLRGSKPILATGIQSIGGGLMEIAEYVIGKGEMF